MDKTQELTGKVFDIQGFSVQDGPGIRTTVFLKGCPLRCPWCHSPESQAFHTELNWMEMKCIGIEKCGKCLDVCPHGAISPGRMKTNPVDGSTIQLVDTDRTKCDNCGKCTEACKPKALYMCGKDYTVEELTARIIKDKPFFDHSGGGVTFSGGECLAQGAFMLEILKACKEQGIHTAVDTSGFVPWQTIERILPYTDLFLYDIKNMNSDLHEKIIGVPNELILDNARKIAAAGGKMHIRIPVIPMFNDSPAAIAETGEFIKSLGDAVEVVQILPYHTLGTVKWERLQRKAPIIEAVPPSDELIQARKEQLEALGLNVTVH
jgi:pyruvate formate lyase activating enzyme